jgi:hypothetical protein
MAAYGPLAVCLARPNADGIFVRFFRSAARRAAEKKGRPKPPHNPNVESSDEISILRYKKCTKQHKKQIGIN